MMMMMIREGVVCCKGAELTVSSVAALPLLEVAAPLAGALFFLPAP